MKKSEIVALIAGVLVMQYSIPSQAAFAKRLANDSNVVDKEMGLHFVEAIEFNRDDLDEMDTLVVQNGAVVLDADIDPSKSWCKLTMEHWPEIEKDTLKIPAGTTIEFNKPVVEEKESVIATNYVSKTGRFIERARCFKARAEEYKGRQNSLPVYAPSVAKSTIESVFAGKTQLILNSI